MEIKGLRFKCTCGISPEQYDVYKDGKQVGYVRLRFGNLTCNYPDCGGEELFYEYLDGCNGWQGDFANEEQRQHYLGIIADKINDRLSKENDDVR